MRVIVNATPLIYLGKTGQLELLNKLYQNVFTTPQVVNEVLRPEQSEFNILKQALETWLQVKKIDQKVIDEIGENYKIDIGEASVISLASQTKFDLVILDDKIARSVAISFGLKVTGIIGIILEATVRKIITTNKAKSIVKKLVTDTPFYLSAKLYQKIIEEIDRISGSY